MINIVVCGVYILAIVANFKVFPEITSNNVSIDQELNATSNNVSIDEDLNATSNNVSIDQRILNAAGLNALDVFHVGENSTVMVLQELDIMTPLTEFSEKMASANSTRGKRIIEKNEYSRWPQVYIPYQISRDIKDRAKIIWTALIEVAKYTCIKFVESDTRFPRIWFHDHESRCYAEIGYKRDSSTHVFINKKCNSLDIYVHEILHVLGIYHEHKRPDRDVYVYVDPAYLKDSNYVEIPAEDVNTYGIEYDYRSIMHYSGGLYPKDKCYCDRIGRYTVMSFRDILLLNYAYQCTPRCCPGMKPCPFGGFRIPYVAPMELFCECFCHSGHWDNARQFVQCKYIHRSHEPVYNLKGRSSLPPSEHQECKDLLDSCTSYKEKGLCFTQLVRMKKLCTKTCNFCGKGKDLCMDHDEGCELMAEAGVCKDEGIESFMNNLCPKSCGKCKPISACDIQRAMKGLDVEKNGSSVNSAWIMNNVFLFIMCWWHTDLSSFLLI